MSAIVRDESGVGLIETMLAMVLFALVVTGVDASISMVNARQVQVAGQTQALDQLQLADETLTRDLHAAITTEATPTATSLDFLAELDGQVPEIYATIVNHTLTIGTVNSSPAPGTHHPMITVSGLDSASTFAPTLCSVTQPGVAQPTVYWTSTGVVLSKDSPQPGAASLVKTTMADSDVVSWNIEYNYELALTITGAATSC